MLYASVSSTNKMSPIQFALTYSLAVRLMCVLAGVLDAVMHPQILLSGPRIPSLMCGHCLLMAQS